jgi:DNA-binding MarR family transcriptional regulator
MILLDYIVKQLYHITMDNKPSFNNLMEHFIKIVNKYNALSGIAYDYGTGVPLFPSELHALRAVRESENQNVTGLAVSLGITKSAASQVIQKLERKALIDKYKFPRNDKEVLVRLTDKGSQALHGFENMRNDIFHQLLSEFESLDRNEIELIEHLFRRMEEHFDRILLERS